MSKMNSDRQSTQSEEGACCGVVFALPSPPMRSDRTILRGGRRRSRTRRRGRRGVSTGDDDIIERRTAARRRRSTGDNSSGSSAVLAFTERYRRMTKVTMTTTTVGGAAGRGVAISILLLLLLSYTPLGYCTAMSVTASTTNDSTMTMTTTISKGSTAIRTTRGTGNRQHQHQQQQQQQHRRRREQEEESTTMMGGSCWGSTLESGQQRRKGSYLCYPIVDPVYKFGIDTNDELSYFVNDVKIWTATPPPPETNDCIVFGTNCDVPLQFFRLQNAGSIVGFSPDRSKVYDGHVDGGEYSQRAKEEHGLGSGEDVALLEMRGGSTLVLSEEGAVVRDGDGVATWRIDAPEVEAKEDTLGPTEKPTRSPTTNPPTTKSPTKSPTNLPTKSPTNPPTNRPTNPPTIRPTARPTSPPQPPPTLGTIRGFVWDDSPTSDSQYSTPQDSPLPGASISLTRCSDPLDVVSRTTTSDDGTFEIGGLAEGRYYVRVGAPPPSSGSGAVGGGGGGGASLFAGTASAADWEFAEKDVVVAAGGTGSVVNDDGTSDCLAVGGGQGASTWEHEVYAGMIRVDDDNEEEEDDDEDEEDATVVTVSGQVFWDSNGDGLRDDPPNNDASAIDASVLENAQMVVDLYDCSDPSSSPRWLLLTRTDAAGRYRFASGGGSPEEDDNEDGERWDLSKFLDGRGVTKFLAEFSDPGEGRTFAPPSRDSDVDPSDGRTSCWDLEEDGRGSVVWNAGIIAVAAVGSPPTMGKPTTRPTAGITMRPTPRPTATSPTAPVTTPDLPPAQQQRGGVVGGYAFLDANDDGIRDADPDSEPPIRDVDVRLYACDPDGIGPERLLAVERTDDAGFYGFRNLFAGNYRVVARAPPEYRLSSVWTGGDIKGGDGDGREEVDSALNPATGSTECFGLGLGDDGGGGGGGTNTDISQSVGLVPVSSSSDEPVVISGVVFHDVDGNGHFDESEAGLSGVRVALFSCGVVDDGPLYGMGVASLYTSTDPNGMYGFSDVPPGTYAVGFSHEGYAPSDAWRGSGEGGDDGREEEGGGGGGTTPDVENEADPATGRTECVEYRSGDDVYSLDAGMRLRSKEEEEGEDGESGGDAPNPSPLTTSKPTPDPKGDGSPCSGAPCPDDGTCRNKAGLCGGGIPFCNADSVWAPGCPPREDGGGGAGGVSTPRASSRPSAAPTLSGAPSASSSSSVLSPSDAASAGGVSNAADVSVCNEDGSVGMTTASTEERAMQSTVVSFAYALKSGNGASPDAALIAKFEDELNARLACIYFDDPCLACDEEGNDGNGSDRRVLRGSLREQRMLRTFARTMTVEDSAVAGISPMPRDIPNPTEVCVDSQPDCSVINGRFTSYFPAGTQPEIMEEESEQMLAIVINELSKNDWDGMQVSYDNAPFVTVDEARQNTVNDEDDEDDSLSAGAIAGIVVGILALIAAIAVSAILFIRHKREKSDEQFEQPVYPLARDVEPSLDSKASDDDEFESDDSDDSSRSSSSSSEEEYEEGSDARSLPSSAISGDTFPTNVAQAMPQDLDDHETTDSSDDEEMSFDEESYEQGSETEMTDAALPPVGGGHRSVQRLQHQQSAASDENPAIYEDNVGEYHGKEYPGEYNSENRGFDSDHNYDGKEDGYDGQQDGYHRREQHPQNYAANEHTSDDDDDAGSMMSGDPPGTSYRDLPRGDEWDGVMASPQPMHFHSTPDGGFGNEDFGGSQQGGNFDVYESEGGSLNESYHSSGDVDDGQGNPGSFHSDQSQGFGGSSHHSVRSNLTHSSHSHNSSQSIHSNRSSHAQDSDHSVQSNFSSYSRASRHSPHNDHSLHSQQDENQQDFDQQMNDGHSNQIYRDGNYVLDGNEHHDQHDLPPPPHENEYDHYAGAGASMNHGYADENRMVNQFGDGIGEGNQYNPMHSGNANEQEGTMGDGFDEQSYHSFNPTQGSNPASRPEELDEVSHSSSAYTAVTNQMSNRSPNARPKKSVSKRAAANIPGQETYGEEEESITNIFKSLSEIQTRLASKGKPLEDDAPTGGDFVGRSDYASAHQVDGYPTGHQPPISNGWGKEGIVEDASMDGSQVSNFASSTVRNRRPSQGQWMEPVYEGV